VGTGSGCRPFLEEQWRTYQVHVIVADSTTKYCYDGDGDSSNDSVNPDGTCVDNGDCTSGSCLCGSNGTVELYIEDEATPVISVTDAKMQVNPDCSGLITGGKTTGNFDDPVLDAYFQTSFTFFATGKSSGFTHPAASVWYDNFMISDVMIPALDEDTSTGPSPCGDGVIDAGEQCDDGNIADGDCCSAICQYEANGSSCNDNLFCTTPDTCNGAGTCSGPVNACSDGIACTNDSCNEIADICNNIVNDSNCDNSLYCDGAETCDATLDCQSAAAVACDDSNTCTVDTCDEVADACSYLIGLSQATCGIKASGVVIKGGTVE
jgi:cysteine-rich repeat protein